MYGAAAPSAVAGFIVAQVAGRASVRRVGVGLICAAEKLIRRAVRCLSA